MFEISIDLLPDAKSQSAAVLKMLLENESVSERQTVFNGFRSRISELRRDYGLDIRHTVMEFKSQFGRKSYYRRHYLLTIDREKAIEIYNRINK